MCAAAAFAAAVAATSGSRTLSGTLNKWPLLLLFHGLDRRWCRNSESWSRKIVVDDDDGDDDFRRQSTDGSLWY